MQLGYAHAFFKGSQPSGLVVSRSTFVVAYAGTVLVLLLEQDRVSFRRLHYRVRRRIGKLVSTN